MFVKIIKTKNHFFKKMSRMDQLKEICASLSKDEIAYIVRNKFILGNLGLELVPKHFAQCDICGEPHNETHLLPFDTNLPLPLCGNCKVCCLCKQPVISIRNGIGCGNPNCSISPIPNMIAKGLRIDGGVKKHRFR